MGKPTSLSELRSIRDAQRRAKALDDRRDELIRDAILQEGHSYRAVAEAAGLKATRVHEIVSEGSS
jgi:hypothetical protein